MWRKGMLRKVLLYGLEFLGIVQILTVCYATDGRDQRPASTNLMMKQRRGGNIFTAATLQPHTHGCCTKWTVYEEEGTLEGKGREMYHELCILLSSFCYVL